MVHPLRQFREREGLSQEGLGELLGCSRQTIIRWETGKRKPRIDQLPGITQKTGIPARELRPDAAEIIEAA